MHQHASEADERGPTRRQFLVRSAATTAVAGGLTAAVYAQEADGTPTFALGGRVEAWEGVAPQAISGQDNPTLELTAGRTYRIIWQNLDGQPHNIAIRDSEGNDLQVLQPLDVTADQVTVFDDAAVQNVTNLTWSNATAGNVSVGNATAGDAMNATGNETPDGGDGLVAVTETVSEEGAVQAVEFTANEEMATYICTIHPSTMIGDVSVDGGDATNETDDKNASG